MLGYDGGQTVGRGVGCGKGGYLAALTLGAKVTDQATQGVIRIAKTLGDFRLGLSVTKHRPQGFLAAVQRLLGF